jgi:sentrin-specific protease 8
MNADKIVLSYHDSLLHESDLLLLNEGCWLNDRLIGFVFEFFEKDQFKLECQRGFLSYLNPSTVQYLKLCESLDEASACFLEPLELNKKDLVLIPLNNNPTSESAGGSHWSLLVFYTRCQTAVHYDSTGSNLNEAMEFFKKYQNFFKIDKFIHEKKFPQQTNSSDCGVYLIGELFLFLKT